MRSAPGLEWALWKRLPLFLLVGTLIPVIVAAILWWYRLESVDPATNRIDPASNLPTFPLMLAYGVGSNLYSADVPAKVIAGGGKK